MDEMKAFFAIVDTQWLIALGAVIVVGMLRRVRLKNVHLTTARPITSSAPVVDYTAPPPVTSATYHQVIAFLEQGKRSEAIEFVREVQGVEQRTAADIVEDIAYDLEEGVEE